MSTIAGTSKIFAHDAGGANATVAQAHFLMREGYQVEAYPRGPAVAVYAEHLPQCVRPESALRFLPTDLVVTGLSGIHSKFELEMIRHAREAGVRKIISILDRPHNLDLRFTREGRLVDEPYLPDEIWTPEILETSASAKIQGRLVQRANPYWEYIKEKKYSCPPPLTDSFVRTQKGEYLLYVTDYIVEQNGLGLGYTEFSLLESFLQACERSAPERPIVVKLHPAEKAGKYDELLARHPRLHLHVASAGKLEEYLYFAKAVFGYMSSVFYESVIVPKPTFSVQVGGREVLRRFPEGVKALSSVACIEQELAALG